MDNIRFGSFVAQLRKERGLTQKELAQRLHVTDKAVSKWETGRGFPDLKLLEPLAQTLEVSLVELLQGERTSSPTLSVEEAGQVAARAMDQYQQTTVLRYLRLFRWVCTAAAVFCFLFLLPYLVLDLNKYRTIPIVIQYLKGSYGQVDMGATMALILLSIVPVIIFYLCCQKHIIKGVAAGAVKG